MTFPLSVSAAITLNLLASIVAGGIVGYERTVHGRPAGFRTMVLICLTSCMLTAVSVYPGLWPGKSQHLALVDPSRIIQGLLTGVGFLGAGVIVKDGLNIRGLTTAATIWLVAGIGVLMGLSFYATGTVATLLTLAVLTGFQHMEGRMPKRSYLHANVVFNREDRMGEDELSGFIQQFGFRVAEASYRLNADDTFEYHLVLHTTDNKAGARLVNTVAGLRQFKAFALMPSRE